MAKSERVLMPLDLRRAVDRDPEVVRLRGVVATLSRWLVAIVVVTCLLAVAFFLASCAADLPSIAADDVDAGVDADELEVDAGGSVDAHELEVELETSPATDSAKPIEDTTAPDVASDTGTHDTAPDVVDAGPCVTKCVVAGGVPLGYFCSLPSDCCSGHCGGPDRKCLPPADACAGCWNECP
jgi:hypothetical protein